MWPHQGYYSGFQGWPGQQQYANALNPSPQQQSNPSDWAAKAQQWAHQKQMETQYYQQQHQQTAQWQQYQQPPHGLPHQQPQPLLQQQQPYQVAGGGVQPSPHIQPQTQQQGLMSLQQHPAHLQQQQPLLSSQPSSMTSPAVQTPAMQHQQQGHTLPPTQPLIGGGVASGQGQVHLPHHSQQQFTGHQPLPSGGPVRAEVTAQPGSAAPQPLFPTSQAPPPSSHAYQPHPPPPAQPDNPAIQRTPPLLGKTMTGNLGSSPRSTGTPAEGLLGRSPVPNLLKPRTLMNSPSPALHRSPVLPTSESSVSEQRKYGPGGGEYIFHEDMVGERSPRFQDRPQQPGLHRPIDRAGPPQHDKVLWEGQGQLQEREKSGEIPSHRRPPTEVMSAVHEGTEHFDYYRCQHEQEQPSYDQEESNAPDSEAEYRRKWPDSEGNGRDEFPHEHFQRQSPRGEEWGLYGSERDAPADEQPPAQSSSYGVEYEGSERATSSPSVNTLSTLQRGEATISSLRKEAVAMIPGLGGGFEEEEREANAPAESTSKPPDAEADSLEQTSEQKAGVVGDPNQATHMIQSLGKIVSQLQTLKGLTSSLQLLQTFPKEGKEEAPGRSKPKERSESELTEETKRKVAALLASESDSDGEQGAEDVTRDPDSRPRQEAYSHAAHEMEAREFDGTFNVKPQVYGTYANERDYPPQSRSHEGQRDYPPSDYRDRPEHLRYPPHQPPPRMEREGYRPPPRDYYPREGYEPGYRRDYPPGDVPAPRDVPPPERGYDYDHSRAAPHDRDYDRGPPPPHNRDYDRGPPPPRERDYDRGPPPPHERDYDRGLPPPRERDYDRGPPPPRNQDYDRGPPPPRDLDYDRGPPPPRDRDYDRGLPRDPAYQRGGPPPRDRDYEQELPPRGREYERGPPPHSERVYDPPSHQRDYPRPPPQGSIPYYSPPREGGGGVKGMEVEAMDLDHGEDGAAPEKISIASKLQTIDYSHGASHASLDSVDYNHRGYGSYKEPPSYPPPAAAAAAAAYTHPFDLGYTYPPGGAGYPPGQPGFLPHGLDAATLFAAYASQAGESKRKALPSWLREELEKMEKKRRKEMEKEALELARHGGEGEQRAAWRDEVDSDQDEEEEKDKRGRKRESRDKDSEKRRGSGERESSRQRHSRSSYHRSHSRSKSPNKSGSPPQAKRHREEPEEDEEDKQVALIMKIRKTLTEVLLEVTNREVMEIARETLEEERNPKLSFAMKSAPKVPAAGNNVLAGLSMYDSDISDSDLDETLAKGQQQSAIDPQKIAEAFKDTKTSSSGASKGNSGGRESTSSSSKHDSSSSGHKSGSKHGSSSKKDKERSSSKSSKKSSSSKKDSDDRHGSSKHSKSESKSSSSKSKSSSSSDKEGKSKHGSSKTHSNRSPSPHRRSSSSSKQKESDSQSKSSKSSSSKSSSKTASSSSSHKSGSRSSRRRSSSPSGTPSSSSRKRESRRQKSRSRSRSRSRSPDRSSGGGGGGKKSSNSRKSPQRLIQIKS